MTNKYETKTKEDMGHEEMMEEIMWINANVLAKVYGMVSA